MYKYKNSKLKNKYKNNYFYFNFSNTSFKYVRAKIAAFFSASSAVFPVQTFITTGIVAISNEVLKSVNKQKWE